MAEHGERVSAEKDPRNGEGLSELHCSVVSCNLDGKSVDPLMVLDYIKSIREECVAALAESRETSSLSLADEKYR